MSIKNNEALIRHIKESKPLTTFQVSRICGVVHSTVSNWIGGGKLTGYRTPGGHRRIRVKDLLFFLKLYDMPVAHDILKAMESSIAERETLPPSGPKRKPSGPKNILIVEDDRTVSDTLLEVLKKDYPDARISQAFDGFQAGKQIAVRSPDIVILDLLLPGIDGFRIVENIRRDASLEPVKIIAVSAFADAENRRKLDQAGGVDLLLPKPLDMSQLKFKINQLLEPSPA